MLCFMYVGLDWLHDWLIGLIGLPPLLCLACHSLLSAALAIFEHSIMEIKVSAGNWMMVGLMHSLHQWLFEDCLLECCHAHALFIAALFIPLCINNMVLLCCQMSFGEQTPFPMQNWPFCTVCIWQNIYCSPTYSWPLHYGCKLFLVLLLFHLPNLQSTKLWPWRRFLVAPGADFLRTISLQWPMLEW